MTTDRPVEAAPVRQRSRPRIAALVAAALAGVIAVAGWAGHAGAAPSYTPERVVDRGSREVVLPDTMPGATETRDNTKVPENFGVPPVMIRTAGKPG